jgi:hypothetical protein
VSECDGPWHYFIRLAVYLFKNLRINVSFAVLRAVEIFDFFFESRMFWILITFTSVFGDPANCNAPNYEPKSETD